MDVVATDWDSCARFLGRALCRYNGLTNFAKLESISDVIAGEAIDSHGERLGDLFESKPFCYAYEILKQFEDMKGGVNGARSAEVHMHHAIAFDFLLRTIHGGRRHHKKLSSTLESTTHIALAPLGRAYRSANVLPEPDSGKFKSFIWNYALLECDFDMYGLMIKMSEENSNILVDAQSFYKKFYDIKRRQIEWLKEKFPYAARRTDIQRNMKCIGRRVGEGKHGRKRVFELDAIFPFSDKSRNDHYGQRKRWASKFGHFANLELCLTESGQELSRCLPPTDDVPFFWLAPPEAVARTRFLNATGIKERRCSPAWNVLVPESTLSTDDVDNEIVDVVAEYMKASFETVRLKNFEQSSLDVVLPYVRFVERERLLSGKTQHQVDAFVLFREIFAKHRDKFVCALHRNLSKSHYWLRK